jgi:hypothetical protein
MGVGDPYMHRPPGINGTVYVCKQVAPTITKSKYLHKRPLLLSLMQ